MADKDRPMIRLEGLTKKFGDLVAVDGLDLEVRAGEFFAFIGPNGAGKTTTIKLIAGLLRPTQGKAFLGDYDVQGQYLKAKSLLSYVPDQPYLYDKLTGREFLQFVARMYDVEPGRARLRINELSEMFGFKDYMDQLGESYSHGMKQRIVIGAALLHEPKVIVVDEPMVGLDPRSASIVKQEFKRRSDSGVTIFMSTHTLAVAEELAERVGIIQKGRLTALGSLQEIYRKARTDSHLEQAFLKLTQES